MAYPEHMRRTIVLKANRETLILVTAACGMTFALAYAIHSRPQSIDVADPPSQQGWTGGLADVSTFQVTSTPAEPLTSAAMTVPKSALALPNMPKSAAKPRACDGAACPARVAALPVPQTSRRETGIDKGHPEARHKEASLMTRLNPLNHVPDIVRKPFVFAGDTVSGWFKSF